MKSKQQATAKPKGTMKPAKGKTWTDKVNDRTKEFIVKKLDKEYASMPAGSRMLIATPKIIDNYVRQIPKGKSSSMTTLRNDLAVEYHADFTCPLTSGIFLRIVSEAAHEQLVQGVPIHKVTPFWRIVDEKSPLNNKLSFGPAFVKSMRKKEGIIPTDQTK